MPKKQQSRNVVVLDFSFTGLLLVRTGLDVGIEPSLVGSPAAACSPEISDYLALFIGLSTPFKQMAMASIPLLP
jgi:hypothetical protein